MYFFFIKNTQFSVLSSEKFALNENENGVTLILAENPFEWRKNHEMRRLNSSKKLIDQSSKVLNCWWFN